MHATVGNVGLPSRKLGRYELLTALGRGGMAELYLAHLHGVAGFTKVVAIKRMLPHISQDKQFVELFLNEGKIAARLSHPNVCQVYELGEQNGELFLAMEYLEGVAWETLVQQLREEPEEIARVVTGVIGQACDGLHYAHELRDVSGKATPVIHRDVSPQNLFVTVDGMCKVLDFGVSKMMTEGTRTRSGVIKGKLPYMSPEQIAGEPVDARSDTFAVGIVLWEAFSGKHLFHRSTDYAIWTAVMNDVVPPVTGYGDEITAIIARALQRDRARRYRSCAELARDLRHAAGAYGGAATSAEIAALVRERCAEPLTERKRAVAKALAAVRGTEVSTVDSIEAPVVDEPGATLSMALRAESVAIASKRRWFPIVLGVLLVAAIAVAALVYWIREEPEPIAMPVATPRAIVPDAQEIDAAPVASEPVVEPKLPAKRKPKKRDAATAPSDTAREPTPTPQPADAPRAAGSLTVDSKPFARIFIDGKQRAGKEGETPVFRIALPAGHHKIRLVLEDGRERTLEVDVQPGADVNLGTITWPAD